VSTSPPVHLVIADSFDTDKTSHYTKERLVTNLTVFTKQIPEDSK